jgi:hypothetical protein
MARTAIPITHYRILAKEQPTATHRLVALRSSRRATYDDSFWGGVAFVAVLAGPA